MADFFQIFVVREILKFKSNQTFGWECIRTLKCQHARRQDEMLLT